MRKLWKALVGVLAAVAMLATGGLMATSASADGIEPYTLDRRDTNFAISITNEVEGYTYEAYQIFAGDVNENTLSNIVWGSNVSEEGKTELLKFVTPNAKTPAELAEKLTNDNAAAFAQEAAKYLTGTAAGTTSTMTDGKYTINGLQSGYYLVKNSQVPQGASYTEYLLKVVGNAEITPKGNVPTVTKKVQDINDFEDADILDNAWQDSADHDLNDKVPFQLTGTMPTNIASYTSYKYVFHDTLSKGLTYNTDSIHVYAVNGKDKVELKANGDGVTTGYTVTTGKASDEEGAYQGGSTLTIGFADIKNPAVKNDDETATINEDTTIVVEYTATLNENAVIGSAGNPNKVYLEFSNDPNNDVQDAIGTTPEDKVVVFTYELDVTKIDDENQPLAGAGFTLSKEYKKADGTTEWRQVGSEVMAIGTDKYVASFKHLDDGNYKIEETTVPAGYNKAADKTFTISATHDATSDDPKLTALTITPTGETAANGDAKTGVIGLTVINTPGSELPSTGGMGTTVLYAAGAVIVIAAALGLTVVLRKRQNAR